MALGQWEQTQGKPIRRLVAIGVFAQQWGETFGDCTLSLEAILTPGTATSLRQGTKTTLYEVASPKKSVTGRLSFVSETFRVPQATVLMWWGDTEGEPISETLVGEVYDYKVTPHEKGYSYSLDIGGPQLLSDCDSLGFFNVHSPDTAAGDRPIMG